jgi:hypothetical protein
VAVGAIYVHGDNRDAPQEFRHCGTFRLDVVEGRIVLLG